MAVLSTADRTDLWAGLMRDLSADALSVGLLKADLRAVVDAADDWANTNAASYNSALPLPGRTALSAADKARVLMLVIARRYLRGV